MSGELGEDEPKASPDTDFKVKVHSVLVGAVTDSIQRFSPNARLYSDCACLDLRHFAQVRENGFPSPSLREISKCLLSFDFRAVVGTLHGELFSLTSQWDRLKMSRLEVYIDRTASKMPQGNKEDLSVEQ